MNKIKILKSLLFPPTQIKYKFICMFPNLINNDRKFIEYIWKFRMNYPLNLDNPQTFNEKLQWLKLYDRQPIYTTMVDKYAVKKYVANIIGEEYIIPTLGVWDTPEEIDWNKLPNQFVLKCTHDSGGLVICKDKSCLDKKAAIKKLWNSLRYNYYMAGREWPYKNVKRRIIAEQYMEDKNGELNDYKVLNFNGEPKVIQLDYNRFKGHKRSLYTSNWEKIDANIIYPSDPTRVFDKPKALDEIKLLARKLSFNQPFLRTDFYNIDGKVYFGELTFFPESGFGQTEPLSYDKLLGSWIELPNKQ